MPWTQVTPDERQAVEEAIDIAHTTVWCAMTTVDAMGRPRNRIVHPVWQFDGEQLTGWLTTRRTPLKSAHLARNPHVSLAYIASNTDFASFDCAAEWVEDAEEKRACWEAFVNAAPPVRYDPATIWPEGPGAETFAVLRFTPYRVQVGRAEQIAKGQKPSLVRFA